MQTLKQIINMFKKLNDRVEIFGQELDIFKKQTDIVKVTNSFTEIMSIIC